MHTDNLRKLALETNDGVLRGPAFDAADEIDRLRAEIDWLTKERQAFEGMAKDNDDRLQKAEAERDEARAQVGAAETTAGSWALDTSTDSEILVKGGCSVIEGNDAHYLLRLIAADTSTPTPDANARWWSGEATIGEIREVAAQHAVARLVEAARAALNYLENTEGEFGITLGSATGLRAALAAMEASDDRA